MIPLLLLAALIALGEHAERNPETAAARDSETFHGEPDQTLRLTGRDRAPLPREVVVIGELESFVYKPDGKSYRGEYLWEHKTLDRGPLAPKAKRRPLLVADPRSHRIQIVRGDARFDPQRGVVG